jgi:hypothetical protein
MSEEGSKTYLLSPLDQHGPQVYTRMALVFPCTDHAPAIATLQAALAKTCDQIPYLKGRVYEHDISQRKQSYLVSSPSDPTPQFEEKPIPTESNYPELPVGLPTYAELASNRTPFPTQVFAHSPTGNGAKVIAGSYTKIEGGLIMCIVTYHKVIDGTGYSEILRVLAENARNIDNEAFKPAKCPDPEEIAKRRSLILAGKELDAELQSLDFDEMLKRHPVYTLRSKAAERAKGVAGMPKPGSGTNKVFAFSGRKVAAAKEELAKTLPKEKLTVNNILTALMWMAVTHIRATREEDPIKAETSKMDYSVGARRIVGPSLLDPPYLGNALCYAAAELPLSTLSAIATPSDVSALVPVIESVIDGAAHLTPSYVNSLVRLSDSNPDLSDITPAWLLNGPSDLHFTSWAQVGVYDLDFGPKVGKPGYMRSTFMKFDGVVNFLPRRRVGQGEEEEMECSVLLRMDDMERLSKDERLAAWLV